MCYGRENQIRSGKVAEDSAGRVGVVDCSHEQSPITEQQTSESFSHKVGAGPAVKVSNTVRLLPVSCSTNGEQKHVMLLQGSSGAEGLCSSPGRSQQESAEGRITCLSSSWIDSAAADARQRTGHAPITKSIRNEPNRWAMPKSVSPGRTTGKRRVSALIGGLGSEDLLAQQPVG